MISIRKSSDRGRGEHGWLSSRHTFSFADYYDSQFMGFRSLRVINEDRVEAGMGFGTHGHRDMEIISWVLDGVLDHKDSMGHRESLRAGELQHITAGTGIRHSEFNGSPTELVHFLQIWIEPRVTGLQPRYDQKAFPIEERRNVLRLVLSPNGEESSVKIEQDARLFIGNLEPGKQLEFEADAGRFQWLQVARGEIELNGVSLSVGDGAACSGEPRLHVVSTNNSELLFFDLR
jgi:quercetin 2,3-dioxygenase